jgi:hypothetical protein
MSRGLTTAFKNAAAAHEVIPFNLVHMAFDSGDVRIWTGHGTLTWGGYDWTGAGAVIGISAPSENVQVEAKGVTVSLSGLPADILAIALDEDYQGRQCTIYYGLFSAGSIIADPVISFRGPMDVMPITDTGETSAISVAIENRLIVLHRSRNRRWTDADQKMDYPDDKGFEFVQSIQEKPIDWGQAGSSSSGASVTSGHGGA